MSIDEPRRPAPVAAVVVDSGLAHLDRLFEYAVPPDLDEAAQPGARVRVRFAGRDLDAFIVERRSAPEHAGRLAELRRVVSPEPVLTPEVLASARDVADAAGGVLGDVLRLAIPKRHAAAERALAIEPPVVVPTPDAALTVGPWAAYPAGEAFLRRVSRGEAPAAAWLALPGRPAETDWPIALAYAVSAAQIAGRGALLVVPDARDIQRVDAALTQVLGRRRHVILTADQGPQARYTAWLKVLRGHVDVVVGTRAASYAPVHNLGLVAWWDDGDDLHEEPRAPYAHVRDVLAVRARATRAAVLVGGFSRSVQIQDWIAQGRLVDLQPTPDSVRAAVPRVRVMGEGLDPGRDGPAAQAQLPPTAWRVAKAALEQGPVLVQVPRRGYRPSLRCQTCREAVRCGRCHGPMGQGDSASSIECRWCGWSFGPAGFECPHCHGRVLRTGVVGSRRTAEELGRAFPGVAVLTSGGDQVLAAVGAGSALVVATPGAEPVADGGYAACLLLDAWALLDRPELDAAPETLRRWLAAAALTRPGSDGGQVVLAGAPEGPALPAVEALARWDPVWLAGRELAERGQLRLPPTVAIAQLVGPRAAVGEAADALVATLQASDCPHDRLGPLAADPDTVQILVRVPRDRSAVLATAVRAVRATRSARKDIAVGVRMGWTGSPG